MRPAEFIQAIQSATLASAFNPYRDRCELCDLDDAPQRRSAALFALLTVATQREIDSVWVGRDLGYRGGRRTGLALTDDVHIGQHARPLGRANRASYDRPSRGRTDGCGNLEGDGPDWGVDFFVEYISVPSVRGRRPIHKPIA